MLLQQWHREIGGSRPGMGCATRMLVMPCSIVHTPLCPPVHSAEGPASKLSNKLTCIVNFHAGQAGQAPPEYPHRLSKSRSHTVRRTVHRAKAASTQFHHPRSSDYQGVLVRGRR